MSEGNIAVIGTTSSHGGVMVTANGNNFRTAQGAVCLQGDLHSCPIPGHGVTAIVSGCSASSMSNGKAVAIEGAQAACGATLNGAFASDANTT